MATQLRKYTILHPFFALRDRLMDKTGLFQLKRKIKQRLLLKRLVREDAQLKREINKKIFSFPNDLITNTITNDDIIISLTSYGKRVEDALPYALYSLLTQTVLPKKIVVYLDWDNWSDDRLPAILKKIQSVGVTFSYCEDLRSYKKFIPALKEFPNNPIVTVDDDLYYNPNYMEWMTNAYNQSDKETILGQWGCIPLKKNGKYLPYSKWPDCKLGTKEDEKLFIGCCGICYPPRVFDNEIFNEQIFMQLCPTADDIWFWAMEERLGIKRDYIEPWGHGYHVSVNRIEEYDWTQRGTLMYQNVVEGRNDQQLRKVLEYYKL